MDDLFRKLGLVAAVAMPLWNIPLIWRVFRRRSSEDISLAWLFGVWGCMLLMLPSAWTSADLVLKVFGVSNVILFSFVVLVVVLNRRKK